MIRREPGKARSIAFARLAPVIPADAKAEPHSGVVRYDSPGQTLLFADAEGAEGVRQISVTNGTRKWKETVLDARTRLITGDALEVMQGMDECSVHAIVTDPPYGLVEYGAENHDKMRGGKGGVWRIPPKLDGVQRAPLPRFTVLTEHDRKELASFFRRFAQLSVRVLVPGGHVLIASNPLLSTTTFAALCEGGLEKRGEVIRLVTTLRGGDRPKGAELEYPEVSVMPRSSWEPWGLFRKPISERTVAGNLKHWGTGALRRPGRDEPFKDVIECAPARGREREIAPHPSLKPQKLMRLLVRASLPLGTGTLLDPFCGSGATLAAAAVVGYSSIGIERDPQYAAMATTAFAQLKALQVLA